jgi:WD40 repeat protein
MTQDIKPHRFQVGFHLESAFSFDGKYLAVSSGGFGPPDFSRAVKVWETETGNECLSLQAEISPWRGHWGDYCHITFSPVDYSLFIAKSGLWDVSTGNQLQKLRYSTLMAFSPNGQTLAIKTRDKIYLVERNTGHVVKRLLKKHASKASEERVLVAVKFLPDEKNIIGFGWIYDQFDHLYFWDINTGNLTVFGENQWSKEEQCYIGLRISSNGRFVATSNFIKKHIEVWERNTLDEWKWTPRIFNIGSWCHSLGFPADENLLIWVKEIRKDKDTQEVEHVIQICDTLTGMERIHILVPGKCWVKAMSPDNRILATLVWVDSEYWLKLWTTTTGEEVACFPIHCQNGNLPRTLHFSPEGKWLAVAFLGSVDLWEVSAMLS